MVLGMVIPPYQNKPFTPALVSGYHEVTDFVAHQALRVGVHRLVRDVWVGSHIRDFREEESCS